MPDLTEALRESEQRYRILFEQAPFGVFVYDRKLKIRECNARFIEILRSTPERIVGLDMTTLRDQSVRPALDRALAGESGLYEGPYMVTTSGAAISVTMRCSPLRDKSGAVVGAMGVVEDVTERVRAEAQFRTLIERAPDAIGVFSRATRRIVYANPALAELLGYQGPEELIGMREEEPIHPDDRPILEARMPLGEKGHALPLQEFRMVKKGGGVVHVEVLSLPIEYGGEPAILSFARDLTERKLMQARLLLTVRMASVGTMAAGVAHEINNPLAYLMANLDMVVGKRLPELARAIAAGRDPDAPEGDVGPRIAQITEMLEIAREGADRVRNIVRDLKTFSRGDDEEQRGPVDVRRVLDASINMAWNEIRHRARLVRDYAPVPTILANESRLGQVFLNLLVNAAQAFPVGAARENEIRVRTRETPDGQVIVEVTDTGPGIPPELQRRIFNPFFTTKPIGVGTGLGLWICEGVVTSLGGSIAVESDRGKGATFRVVFPSRPAKGPGSVPPPDSAEPPIVRGRVLIIDDEQPLLRTLAATVGEENEVVALSTGREALHLLAGDARFDVILCDLMMPDVTGMDLYEETQHAHPELVDAFIFLTGGAFTPRARDFLDTAKVARLEKPFNLVTLLSMVRKKVASRRP